MLKATGVKLFLVLVLVLGFTLVPGISGAQGMVSMNADVGVFGPHSMYLAVWNYAQPTISDMLDRKPLFRMSVTNGSDVDVCAKYQVWAEYDDAGYSGGIGSADGWAVFEPVVVPRNTTVNYEVTTEGLDAESWTGLIGRLQNSEEIDIRNEFGDQLGPFANWDVMDSDYSSTVDENKLWPVLARMAFPSGYYNLAMEAWYQPVPASGTCPSISDAGWTSIGRKDYDWEIKSIGPVEAVYPLPMHETLLSPSSALTFLWDNPELPKHVKNVDAEVTLQHRGKTIWDSKKRVAAGSISGNEYAVTLEPGQADENFIGGETYTWSASISDPDDPSYGVIGREIARAETTVTFPNTDPTVEITNISNDGLTYTFTGQITDTEDTALRGQGYPTPQAQYCWTVEGAGSVSCNKLPTPDGGEVEFSYTLDAKGYHTVKLQAWDQHGSTALASDAVQAKPPVVETPVGTVAWGAPQVTVSAQVSDPDSDELFANLQILKYGNVLFEEPKTVAPGEVRWEIDTPVLSGLLMQNGPGAYVVQVVVIDELGQGALSPTATLVDFTGQLALAPAEATISFGEPLPFQVVSSYPQAIQGTLSVKETGLVVPVTVPSGSGIALMNLAPQLVGFPLGQYTLVLDAGQLGSTRATLTVTSQPVQPPVLEPPGEQPPQFTSWEPGLSITSPAQGTSFAAGARVTLEAQVTDVPAGKSTGDVTWTLKRGTTSEVLDGPYYTFTLEDVAAGAVAFEASVTGGVPETTVVATRSVAMIPVGVTITAPVEGTVFVAGDTVVVDAVVTGMPANAEMKWYAGSRRLLPSQDGKIRYTFTGGDGITGQVPFKLRVVLPNGKVAGTDEKAVQVVQNQPPAAKLQVLPSADGLTYNPNQELTFTASATDPEGDGVEWFWLIKRSGEIWDSSQGSSNVKTVKFTEPGMYVVQAQASDTGRGDAAKTGSASVQIIVVEQQPEVTNNAPTVSISQPSEGASFVAGQRIDVSATVSDADNDTVYVTWKLILGGQEYELGSVAGDTCDQAGNCTAALEARLPDLKTLQGKTSATLQAVANDLKSGGVSSQVSVYVEPVPQIIAPEPAIAASEENQYVVGLPSTFYAQVQNESELQGQKISYVWSVAKSGGQATTGVGPEFTITFEKSGLYVAQLQAISDLGGSGTTAVQFMVDPNQPPTLELQDQDGNPFPNPTTLEPNQEVQVQAVVSDPENSLEAVTWSVSPEGIANLVNNGSQVTFSSDTPGSYLVMAMVADNVGQKAGDAKTIVVQAPPEAPGAGQVQVPPANVPPTVTVTSTDLSALAGQAKTFQAEVRDTDGASVTLLWLVDGVPVPGSQQIVELGPNQKGAGSASITFPAIGSFQLSARAIDAAGANADSTKSVTVTNPDATQATGTIVKPLPNTLAFEGSWVEFEAQISPADASAEWWLDGEPLETALVFGTDTLKAGTHLVQLTVEGEEVDSRMVTVDQVVLTRARVGTIYGIEKNTIAELKRAQADASDEEWEELKTGDTVYYDLYEGDQVRVVRSPKLVVKLTNGVEIEVRQNEVYTATEP